MHKGEVTATTRVHLALFVTMMVWGINLSAVKGLTENLDPMLVASVRMAMASLVLAVIALIFNALPQKLTGKNWQLIFLAAFFLVYCQQIAFAEGLFRTSATNAALVMTLGPTVSLSLEATFFRRAVKMRQIAGVVLSLVGVSVVILNRPHAIFTGAAWGDLWIFLSVFSFAMGGLSIQRLTRVSSPLVVSLMVHALGALMLCLHTSIASLDPIREVINMSTWQWLLAAFSAIFATGIGSIVWSKGIATIGVGSTSSYISWVPIFGVFFGAIFFAEAITLWHVAGLVSVIAGTTMIIRQ